MTRKSTLLIATTLHSSHFFITHWSSVSSCTISFGRDNILLNIFVSVMQRQPPDLGKLVQVLNTNTSAFSTPHIPYMAWASFLYQMSSCLFLTIFWGFYYSNSPGDALKIFFQSHETHIHPQWFSLAIGSVWVIAFSLLWPPVTSTQWSQGLDL